MSTANSTKSIDSAKEDTSVPSQITDEDEASNYSHLELMLKYHHLDPCEFPFETVLDYFDGIIEHSKEDGPKPFMQAAVNKQSQ